MILDHTNTPSLVPRPISSVSMLHVELGMGLGIPVIEFLALRTEQAWRIDPCTYYKVSDDGPNRRRRVVPANSQTSIGLATDSNIHWFGKTCT